MRRNCAILLCGCSSIAATAAAQPATHAEGDNGVVQPRTALPISGPVGYLYVNARTGERTVTEQPSQARGEKLFFVNRDYAANGGFFWPMDDPSVGRLGHSVRDWGDIEFDSIVDGVSFSYTTNVGNGSSVPGYSVTLTWFDSDPGRNDPSAVPIWSYTLPNAPGGAGGGFVNWIVTVDFAGTPSVFEISDTDGTYTGMLGTTSTGADFDDTDGCPKADFGWSYTFDQSGTGLPVGICGPVLVLPASADIQEDDDFPTGASGNADGVEDALDLYDATGTHVMTFNMGGWVPGSVPYASTYMGLHGRKGLQCGCEFADYNGDTCVDILDFLDFLGDFGGCVGMPIPCGVIGNPDQFFPDGFVDILDALSFLDLFNRCF